MTREVKALVLVVLTLTAYGAFNYFLKGSFVYPLPLNEFVFFAVALQFSIWHYKKRLLALIVCSVGLFGVLSSQVLWEIIFPTEDFETFLKSPWIHWFYLLHGLSIVIWGISMAVKQREILPSLLTVLGVILFGFGFYIPIDIYMLIGFAFLVISSSLKPVHKPFHLLWILLFILKGTKCLMIGFG